MRIAALNGNPELFFSIQGEGRSLGRPSVFVRGSYCNLHCQWCDTDYTWNWSGTPFRHERDEQPGYRKFEPSQQVIELSTTEVVARAHAFDCANIVLTGGEPLLQQADWVVVMRQLRELRDDYSFEVETNGTIRPSAPFDALIDQYNVSPKTANSGVERRLRERSEALLFLAASPKATFKFVVREPTDSDEIAALVERYGILASHVYLMAEGTTSTELRRRQRWLVDRCKQRGYHFSDRLQVHLWGDRRGV